MMILKKEFPAPSPEEKDQLIISADEFSIMVEERSLSEHISCFDVIMNMVETDKVGIDNIPTLLSDRLKNILELDAKNLNLLKKEIINKKSLL